MYSLNNVFLMEQVKLVIKGNQGRNRPRKQNQEENETEKAKHGVRDGGDGFRI